MPVPVAETESAGAAVPVAEEPAPEPAVEEPVAPVPAPVPAPAPPPEPAKPAGPSEADLEKARTSLRVDILETLMMGNWGDLEPKVESVRQIVPGAVEGMSESAMYEAWLKEWNRAELSAPPPQELFAQLRDAAIAALTIGDIDARLPIAPAWSGTPRQQAGAYCSAYNTLQSAFLDALDDHALMAQQDAITVAKEAVPLVEWLQAHAADLNDAPRIAAGNLRAAADAEAAWVLEHSSTHAPIATDVLRGEASALVANVEAARDAFFTAVVDVVRAVNSQKAGWDDIADPALKAQVYEIGMQRVRVVNIRARYKDDVRGWRRHEGADDIRKFLQLVRQAFPDSAPAP
jgi:hypothetical protein